MSTRPRDRARPSIDVASAGSTIAGNRVTMSMRMSYVVGATSPATPRAAGSRPAELSDPRLARSRARRARDARAPRRRRRRPTDPARAPARLTAIVGDIPQDALSQRLEPLRPIGQRRHPHLAGQSVRPSDLADRDEPAACHYSTISSTARFLSFVALALRIVRNARAV